MKESIDSYVKKLCEIKNIEHCDNIVCEYEAGRNNHNDFKIVINDNIEFHIEFKFNALCVNDTPQFVSPMKPSQYLSIDFEPWYYDNYLEKIALNGNLKMPSKEEYLKKIHSNSVECMKQFKEKYDTDINFNKYCKDIDKESIKQFIEMTTINMDKLSDYLLKSQKEKIYMCYKENTFYYETLDEKLYKIVQLEKKENTNYIYRTELGIKLEIKLRFKNGCGLQFPAFQIRQQNITKKELIKLCDKHDIKSPKLKKDICNILNQHNIIY